MGRLEELSVELNDAQARLEQALADNRKDDIENLSAETDRIRCELHTLEDNWQPESYDTDYNELP